MQQQGTQRQTQGKRRKTTNEITLQDSGQDENSISDQNSLREV